MRVFAGMVVRESEDTVLMILKEIYSMSGITPQKPGTDAALPAQQSMIPVSHQAPYLPPQPFHPPGPLPGPQFANGSSSGVGNVPVFTAPPQLTSSAVGGPPLPTAPAPGPTYLDPSSLPPAISSGQSPAVGPPPKSGFIRK